MGRSERSKSEYPAAMRAARRAALHILLPAATRERGELAPAPQPRRVVPGVSVLRQPPHGGHARHQSQAQPTVDAYSGHRSSLSETQLEPARARSYRLSLPAARCLDRAPQPSLEHRYYVCSDARRLSLPGCHHGLVQPFRAQLGTLQYDGGRLLSSRVGGRISLRSARNLELRSGLAIHRRGFPGAVETARCGDQHGRPRPGSGQRLHRAPLAQFEIRTNLPWRLRRRGRIVRGTGTLLPFLQSPASAPGPRLSHAGRPLPSPLTAEVTAIMGGAAPHTPRDLTLFSSRVDGLALVVHGDCRTMVGLDRRIGQRRDATRAPNQARSGWRPSGRLLVSPLHHLRTAEILSKQWGPPHSSFLISSALRARSAASRSASA